MSGAHGNGWEILAGELDRWAAAGRTATFWWRDDDAGRATPALHRLLDLTAAHGIVPLLAVVPAWAEPSLADLVARRDTAIAQHGVAHRDRSEGRTKKTELLDGLPDLEVELPAAHAALGALFGARLLPVLVPPWNRLGTGLRGRLAGLGFRGLSAFGARPGSTLDGLALANCHCDPVDWRGTRGFAGLPAALGQLAGHLRARRLGAADPAEPTGVMSHHAAHDAASWAFLAALAGRITAHPAAAWQDPRTLFPDGA